MTQHTPGPWTIDHDDTPWTEGDAETAQAHGEPFGPTEILFSVRGGETGDDHVVARCPFGMGDTDEDQERQRANARLIAAAPELLWELKRTANQLESIADQLLAPSGWKDNAREVVRLARAVIAKAEG